MASTAQAVGLFIVFCSTMKLASSCGGGDSATTPSPTGMAPANTLSKTIWVRCKSGTKQVCHEFNCIDGETPLKAHGEPYRSETSCLGSTLYQQCYNFATDGFSFGTCQPDYIGCTGPTQKVLGEYFDDPTCTFFSIRVRTYVRCLNSVSNAAQCRPEQANCLSSSETWSPLNNVFFSLDVCINYGIDPNDSGFYRCVVNSTGVVNCKSPFTGCDNKTEMRVPSNVIYSTLAQCSTLGAQQLYDLCYDYTNTDPTYYGTCMPADGTCSGATKTKILSGVLDPYCNAFERDKSKLKYMRCKDTVKKAINCRPTDVFRCNPDGSETQDPVETSFPTSADCKTYLDSKFVCGDYGDASRGCACVQTAAECAAVFSSRPIDLSNYNGLVQCSDVCIPQEVGPYYSCKILIADVPDLNYQFCLSSEAACRALTNPALQFTVPEIIDSYEFLINCHYS